MVQAISKDCEKQVNEQTNSTTPHKTKQPKEKREKKEKTKAPKEVLEPKAVNLSLLYGFTYAQDRLESEMTKGENDNSQVWKQYVKPRDDKPKEGKRHQWVAFVKPEDSNINIRDFIKGVKYTINPSADKKGKNVYKPKQEGTLQKRLFDDEEVQDLEIEIKLRKNVQTSDGSRTIKLVQQLNCDAKGKQDALKLDLTQYVAKGVQIVV